MDVTFFENQPFYPKTDIQGETPRTQEYQFWVAENTAKYPTLPLSTSTPNTPKTSQSESLPKPIQPENTRSQSPTQLVNHKEFRVYSRRQKQENVEHQALPLPF